MTERIKIYIALPDQLMVQVIVNQNHPIRVLRKLKEINEKKCILMFKEVVLMDERTFKYYKIQNDDLLLAFANDQTENSHFNPLTHPWARNEEHNLALKSPSNFKEFIRLKDLKMQMMELKDIKFNRRFKEAINKIQQRTIDGGYSVPLTFDYPKLKEPSSSPLPVVWGE